MISLSRPLITRDLGKMKSKTREAMEGILPMDILYSGIDDWGISGSDKVYASHPIREEDGFFFLGSISWI